MVVIVMLCTIINCLSNLLVQLPPDSSTDIIWSSGDMEDRDHRYLIRQGVVRSRTGEFKFLKEFCLQEFLFQ
jgi:hypothetical protein